ncbi:hypothetical protein CsSME_00007608 [Camellia sinensis var. sinensis]
MLRTYCRAIDATFSCMWLSNTNSNAIVITDLVLPLIPAQSLDSLFPAGPISRAEARSRVRFGLEASFPESRGMMRKPEGKRGASSANEASIGANMSSAQVPTAFSSMPLHSCHRSIQNICSRLNK